MTQFNVFILSLIQHRHSKSTVVKIFVQLYFKFTYRLFSFIYIEFDVWIEARRFFKLSISSCSVKLYDATHILFYYSDYLYEIGFLEQGDMR